MRSGIYMTYPAKRFSFVPAASSHQRMQLAQPGDVLRRSLIRLAYTTRGS